MFYVTVLYSEFDHLDFFSFLREGAQIQLFSHYSFLSVRRPRESIFTFQILLSTIRNQVIHSQYYSYTATQTYYTFQKTSTPFSTSHRNQESTEIFI